MTLGTGRAPPQLLSRPVVAPPRALPLPAEARSAHAAGIPIVAGTDALGGSTPNIHVELQLLVDSVGMSPLDALVAATANGARAIGAADSLGTVAPGKLAGLVLLGADPLADIANTQTVEGVMKSGRWHPRAAPMRAIPRARPPRTVP